MTLQDINHKDIKDIKVINHKMSAMEPRKSRNAYLLRYKYNLKLR